MQANITTYLSTNTSYFGVTVLAIFNNPYPFITLAFITYWAQQFAKNETVLMKEKLSEELEDADVRISIMKRQIERVEAKIELYKKAA